MIFQGLHLVKVLKTFRISTLCSGHEVGEALKKEGTVILTAPWSCLALALCPWLQFPADEAENLSENNPRVAEDYTQKLRCLNLD